MRACGARARVGGLGQVGLLQLVVDPRRLPQRRHLPLYALERGGGWGEGEGGRER